MHVVQSRTTALCAVQEGACGPNALCKVVGKNVRCSCPERFAGVPTPQQGCVRIPGCNKEEDCRPGEVCQEGNCVCAIGFINTPAGCQDINECENSICHPSAKCANIPGSFKCTCPRGLVGDPVLEMEEAIVNVSIIVTELNVEQMQIVKFAIINLSASVLTSMLATQAPILVAQRLSVSKTVTALVIRCVKWRTTDVLMLAVW